jgi:hypothetical protein
MKTPEGVLKDKIKSFLTKQGAYYFMPVQTGYGRRAVDFLGCYRGVFFGIETKAPGKMPSSLQELCMREIHKAGGEAMWCDNFEHFFAWWGAHFPDALSKDAANAR